MREFLTVCGITSTKSFDTQTTVFTCKCRRTTFWGYGAKSAREALQQRETFKVGIDLLIAVSLSADDGVTVCIR